MSAATKNPSIRDAGRTDWLVLVAVVGAALNAGVFFSWSTMVMPAVDSLPTVEGIAAMQELDGSAPVPYSLLALPASALCIVAIVRGFGRLASARGWLMLVGGLVFIAAALLTTFVANVPISYSIDQLDPAGTSDERWRDLVDGWTFFNHLRTVGSTAAAVLLAAAVRTKPGAPARGALRPRSGQQAPAPVAPPTPPPTPPGSWPQHGQPTGPASAPWSPGPRR